MAVRAASAEAMDAASGADEVILQYVILRRDLWREQEWPLGSVVAQACHAATAALWLSRDEAATQSYCGGEGLDHMHKVRLAPALARFIAAPGRWGSTGAGIVDAHRVCCA